MIVAEDANELEAGGQGRARVRVADVAAADQADVHGITNYASSRRAGG